MKPKSILLLLLLLGAVLMLTATCVEPEAATIPPAPIDIEATVEARVALAPTAIPTPTAKAIVMSYLDLYSMTLETMGPLSAPEPAPIEKVVTIVVTATVAPAPTATPTPTPTVTAVADGVVDITRLPIGDGRVSTRALSGNVWSCQTTFQDKRIHEGPWLNGDGTFDYTKKVVVPGEVSWPSSFDVTVVGSLRMLTGNSLPIHTTGAFPIPRNSEAYSYDPNPNGIRSQTLSIELPATPTLADRPLCLRMGPIGIMLTGGLFFNALDAAGVDAVAHEVRDACDGHPQGQGKYHYHNLTPCVDDVESGHSELKGYAFDGFGIYGLRGEGGQLLTNDDLGACHGHTHAVTWDSETLDLFHYHATWEYPYTVGCYRGTPVSLPR